ncbi:MAG: hypothetical protein RLZZ127_1550 [Planctomycetota bacterium]|jgi:tetratricopeptide (TPR) repeat protein
MRSVLLLLLPAALLTADPAGATAAVRITGQADADAHLATTMAARPDGAAPQAQYAWLAEVYSAAFAARAYGRAETAARAMLALWPGSWPAHSNLSVALGKQGRYDEALREAEIAVLLAGPASIHPEAVACSWLLHLGRRDEAMARFAAIPRPDDGHERRLYLGCKACFLASAGDPVALEAAIREALADDPDGANRGFIARDAVFDPYRGAPWFTALVGSTLAAP